MGRRRSLKEDVFEHDGLGRLSRDHRLLFIGLWPRADKAGRLPDRPLRIKAWVFPHDTDLTGEAVDAMLWDLAEHEDRFITRYVVDGKRFIQVTAWDAHQSPHHMEPDSEIPEKCNGDVLTSRHQAVNDAITASERPVNTTQTQTNTQTQTHTQTKDKGGAGGKPKLRPSRRVPDDFELTEELRSYAAQKGVRDVDEEWENFRDHEFKPPGYTDWPATWRRWCRTAVRIAARDSAPHRGGGSLSAAEKTTAAVERVAREMAEEELRNGPH